MLWVRVMSLSTCLEECPSEHEAEYVGALSLFEVAALSVVVKPGEIVQELVGNLEEEESTMEARV